MGNATATSVMTKSIFDAGAVLVPNVLSEEEAQRLLQVIDRSQWSSEIGRRVQHYGWRYAYGAKTAAQPAPPLPSWAIQLSERLSSYFEVAPEQCIINEYEPGQGIGMHADAPAFGPVVASVTLGAAWPMRFRERYGRPYEREGLDGDQIEVLPVGSALVLTGRARTHWMHGISRRDTARQGERRVSATFRTMMALRNGHASHR